MVLLAGAGLYLTFLLRGLQVRRLRRALSLTLLKRSERGGEGDISHFQALMTATSATVGTGNIVGVERFLVHVGAVRYRLPCRPGVASSACTEQTRCSAGLGTRHVDFDLPGSPRVVERLG